MSDKKKPNLPQQEDPQIPEEQPLIKGDMPDFEYTPTPPPPKNQEE